MSDELQNPPVVDLDLIFQPIPGDNPAGESLRYSGLYDEMRDEFITYLNDKACVAQLAITKALRLQQIVSGYLVVENEAGEKSNVEIKDNPRAEALKELLQEITGAGHKVLIWAVFKQNYAEIRAVCTALGLPLVEVHGEISQGAKK